MEADQENDAQVDTSRQQSHASKACKVICSVQGGARAGISSLPHTPRRFHDSTSVRFVQVMKN
eukprot:16442615-Heterocapsa_arctica.AAC.2